MALGGGTFTVQNKVLPGAYINFVSLATATATLSDRGYATMPLELDWGIEGEVFEVTNADFQKNSMKIFGYDYTSEKLKGLRDLFKNITTLFAYRLNGDGVKASNTFATAKYAGTRGNDIKIQVQVNVDDDSLFDVNTYLGTVMVDSQTVAKAADLVANDYVTFKSSAELSSTAGTPLEGGTNGNVTGTNHQAYLDKIESYSFNAMGVVTTENTIKSLYDAFCKRMRDEVGAKFQVILYNKASDYEGVINVKNKTSDEGWSEASLVYWVTGISAGCAVNKSNLNKVYDGEFAINVDYTQTQLTKAIQAGEFTLHQVGDDIRVLEDINSLVTETETKAYIFKDNQTIRVIDQIANDIAVLFNTKYLGAVPNDEAGRISLWADIVKHHEQLQDIRAIENFTDEDVKVSQGDTKKAVVVQDAVTVVNAMAKLYMTVTVM
ncbi:phage tail sheath family protein [Longicatena sp. 210702-DFI.1.36]|uniref:phage tail sheath family protein n=1 Tax=Longicatena TaxID=1918536 RepID=UPI001D06195F|nr:MULTISPECIES: phage tail sheath family protein [Longicatena]MCB6265534.1 phage tail sheath family protein [Longicatena sp. 210702-DFI.1.160]MCB6316313.1 phage tail sheath family protein [Longicatena sp. 210702-DFI.1.100]MCB6430102.1 phage tail sheath family protein [Longicatena sp. 210702-DFI.1.36]MCB6432983.1 phage tail sheath family protein [Longicatena sp. 210702-DFI.1.249]MCB6439726.1 phage tail sheath family protein [Longicatena sp. 210702-DFI.1.255]